MGPGSQRTKDLGLALVSQGLRNRGLWAFKRQGKGDLCSTGLDVNIQASGTWRFVSYDQSLGARMAGSEQLAFDF